MVGGLCGGQKREIIGNALSRAVATTVWPWFGTLGRPIISAVQQRSCMLQVFCLQATRLAAFTAR
jgi:hypothetical protein